MLPILYSNLLGIIMITDIYSYNFSGDLPGIENGRMVVHEQGDTVAGGGEGRGSRRAVGPHPTKQSVI